MIINGCIGSHHFGHPASPSSLYYRFFAKQTTGLRLRVTMPDPVGRKARPEATVIMGSFRGLGFKVPYGFLSFLAVGGTSQGLNESPNPNFRAPSGLRQLYPKQGKPSLGDLGVVCMACAAFLERIVLLCSKP